MGRNNDAAAALEELSKGWPEEMEHPLHEEHPLLKALRPDYTCDSCQCSGDDWSFHCAACDFDLHPDCALEAHLADAAKDLPRTIDHSLHPHPLVKTRLDAFWCDSCGEKGNWWCFYCPTCDFGLHLDCAMGAKRSEPTPLLEKTEEESYWCSKCAEEGKGACYSWEDCKLHLHPRCAAMLRRSWPKVLHHELHPAHDLVKAEADGYYCQRCWTEGKGWSYVCGGDDGCDFHLHPRCAVEWPAVETGWVDRVMHAHHRKQVVQHVEQLKGEVEEGGGDVEEEGGEEEGEEEEDSGEGVVNRSRGVGGVSKKREMKVLEEKTRSLRLESTASKWEKMKLYSAVVAKIQEGSARAVSGRVGGGSAIA